MQRPSAVKALCAVVTLWISVAARAAEDSATTNRSSADTAAQALLEEVRRMHDEMRQQESRHQSQLAALQAQVDELRSRLNAGPPPASVAGAPAGSSGKGGAEAELDALVAGAAPAAPAAGAPQTTGAAAAFGRAVQSFNPDISVNGDFLAAYSNREGGKLDDEFLLREVEISLSGAVDAYTRADVFFSIGREDNDWKVDLEEAYLTFLALPFDLQARVGEMRSEFGKANPTHRHALPWIDYPLVVQRYFGPEGLSGVGAELSWLVPNPANKYISLTYQVFNNDNDTLFAGEASNDFTHLAHLKTFWDLSQTSSLEVGASVAEAPNNSGHGGHRSVIEGGDITYKWKPKEAGLYRSFLWQTEIFAAQADLIGGQEKSWGMYSAADYQFARRWKFGVRYDNTQLPFSSSSHERAYSAFLTFVQSEFVFWRLGYQFTDRNFEVDGNNDEQQIMLQLNWTLGTHPAHKF